MVESDKRKARERASLRFNLARSNTPVSLSSGSTLSVPDLSYLGRGPAEIIKRVLEIEVIGAHIEAEKDHINTKLMSPASRAQFRSFLSALNASNQVKIDGVPLSELALSRTPRVTISEARIPWIIEQLSAGRLQVDVARELDVTRAALSKFMQRNGIDLAGNRFDPNSEEGRAKPSPRGNAVTRAITVEELRGKLQGGVAVSEISRETGVSTAQIYQQLRRFGINYDGSSYDPKAPRPPLPRRFDPNSRVIVKRDERIEEICAALARGESQKQIAQNLGTTPANISGLRKRYGITKDGRRPHRPENPSL